MEAGVGQQRRMLEEVPSCGPGVLDICLAHMWAMNTVSLPLYQNRSGVGVAVAGGPSWAP